MLPGQIGTPSVLVIFGNPVRLQIKSLPLISYFLGVKSLKQIGSPTEVYMNFCCMYLPALEWEHDLVCIVELYL